ncbi:MAG: cytochrome b [Hyphomicrobiaceae bacterium]|nr:MAG: cytochrome b [Hyphomicrobiaceae bacterium]
MSLRSDANTWGSVTRALHWISAIFVLFGLVHGLWMTHVLGGTSRLFHYGWHSQVMIYLGLLVALRVAWRLSEPTPHQPQASTSWEKFAAHAGHIGLYVLLIAVLLTGYLLWSAFPARFRSNPAITAQLQLTLPGGFSVPAVHDKFDRAAARFWEETHKWLSWAMGGLVVLHVLAALRHKFIRHNDIMARMWSGRFS